MHDEAKTETPYKWNVSYSYSSTTGKVYWRAMGPWRETEEEALFDSTKQQVRELELLAECTADETAKQIAVKDARISVLEADCSEKDATIDSLMDQIGRMT